MRLRVSRALAGVLCSILFLELMLRVLPTSTYTDTGYHIDPRIITYRPRHAFISSSGWNFANPVWHRTNNLGFLADQDFVPDKNAVALVGDSYVDASMFPVSESIGHLLQRALQPRAVYALGGPGSNLLDYAERIRYSAEMLRLRDFVVIVESGDLWQSFCGSGNVHSACLDRESQKESWETQASPSRAKRLLRNSALLQYVFGHLRFDPGLMLNRWRNILSNDKSVPEGSPRKNMSNLEVDLVVRKFFERIAPHQPRRIAMVFDSGRRDRGVFGDAQEELRSHAMVLAKSMGAEVIDLDLPFRNHLATSKRSLAVSPSDRHWNAMAVQIVADEVSKRFSQPPQEYRSGEPPLGITATSVVK